MDNKLLTQLRILKMTDSKPNFSELSRIYNIDRRTIKKYYDGYDGKSSSRNKPSKLDIYSTLESFIHRDLCDIWDERLEYVSSEGIQIYETNLGINSHEEYEVAFNRLNEIMSEYF